VSPHFFESGRQFRAWLERNHPTATEAWLSFYLKGAGLAGISYSEALDEALCFGWIDGIRKKQDERSYVIRFTPRQRRSTWSNVNIKRVEALLEAGRMHPAGLAAFAARTADNSGIYSFERGAATFPPELEAEFCRDATAWEFFQSQPPHYRRAAAHWVMSAKREETRARRLATLVADSAAGLRIGPLRRDAPGQARLGR
jgi:uncharacterized protein YdeI (YjbR/CyaY-like superfamily)